MASRTAPRLIYALLLTLPLWGYSLINIAGRGIRIDWAVCALMGCLFLINTAFKSKVIARDSLLLYLFFIELSILYSVTMVIDPQFNGLSIVRRSAFWNIRRSRGRSTGALAG